MKKLLLFLLPVILPLNAVCQDDAVRNIYVEDFDFFISKLEEIHPDPYTSYGGRVEFLREKQKVRDRLAQITDTLTFADIAGAFISVLEDGHTYIKRPYHSTLSQVKYASFAIGVAIDGIYIKETPPGNEALRYSKIVEVEGIAVEALLEKMSRLSASENRYGNLLNLARWLSDNVSASSLLGEQKDRYKMQLEGAEGIFETEIQYSDARFESNSKSLIEPTNGILFTRMLPQAGYIRWNSVQSRELIESNRLSGYDTDFLFRWAYHVLGMERTGNDEEDIKNIPYLYETVLQLLKEMDAAGQDNLIIDLRWNGGGMTPLTYSFMRMIYGDRFLDREFDAVYGVRLSTDLLAKRGYSHIGEYNSQNGTDYVLGDIAFDRFVPHGTIPIDKLKQTAIYNGYDIGKQEVEDSGEILKPYNVYVLVSPVTFSAAYHFLYMLTQMGAVTVGVTPGQSGNTYMESTAFTLPNTGLSASVSNSWQEFFPEDPIRGKELTPDYPMTVEDYRKIDLGDDAEIFKVNLLMRMK